MEKCLLRALLQDGIDLKNNNNSEKLQWADTEPTFGEKTYDFVFNNLINFWLNLGISAMFTYWVNHSKSAIPFTKGTSLEGKPPLDAQKWVTEKLRTSLFKSDGKGLEKAKIMADALTLTTAGTVVMIPSVWIGSKIKAPFVKALDHAHYGADGEQDATIRQRHAMVDQERPPTFLGSVVGRVGTMAAVQLTARFVGHPDNAFSLLGRKMKSPLLQKFHGIDSIAGELGRKTGSTIERNLSPERLDALNQSVRNYHYDWSPEQLKAGSKGVYTNFLQDFGKYTSMDVLYTLVTSLTIHPVLDLIRHVPGMTHAPRRTSQAAPQPSRAVASAAPAAPTAEPAIQETPNDKPRPHVSQISDHARLAERGPEMGVPV